MKAILAAALLALAAAAFAAGPATGPVPPAGTVEAYFTPWDDAEGAIVRSLGSARRSVHVQAYLLTSRAITKALLDAHGRGVRVELVADREMTLKSENSLVPKLAAAGIPCRLETRYANAHNKVLVIDAGTEQATVITGSYNFTWSAQARNAENLLIVRGNRVLAQRYFDNWQRHRDEAAECSAELGDLNERQ